jgi:sulfite exporter TauE/SafE
MKQTLGSHFKNKSYKSLFIIGLLNGLLPCGMVYVALFGAIAMQSAGFGVLYMLLFGLGTVPMMSVVVYVNSFLTVPFRNKIQKVIPYVGVIIGVLFILRGLGLGIPYVSPSNMSLFIQEKANCH